MHLVVAEGEILAHILDSTYPLWNEGLSRQAYGRWNAAQMQTPWGRERLRRVALVNDAGEWVASAKRYRHDVCVGGRQGWMCGIGAVFTRPERRREGHASTLIERMLREARAEGAIAAGLFSEIGEAFYARLGFTTVPMDECTVGVARRDGAPAMLVRTGTERDYDAICAMHQTRSAGAAFALRRDRHALQYAVSKKRLFAGLSPPGTRQLEFFVAEEGATAVAYLVLSQNQHGWTLEEAGDRDPAGARLGAMLQVVVAREPSRRLPVIRAWWPRSFPVPPQLVLSRRTSPKDVLMVHPLAELTLPTSPDGVFYWHSDYF